MADEDPQDGAAANRKYEDWPVEGEHDDEAKYVGMVEGGGVLVNAVNEGSGELASPGAWFYSEENHSLFEREVDRDDRRLLPASDEQSIPDEETLGEAVERLGDELGWDALSDFAREHLEGRE